ncbi:MAG: hypothetical protein COA78_01610 [Blastopirellula sp.]|nr:MAG: hypothetical protein COA78_01610 [Blastopirellula sp.]
MKFRLLVCFSIILLPQLASGMDVITWMQKDQRKTAEGRITATHETGLILQTTDGMMWPITNDEIISRERNDQGFLLLNEAQLSQRLLVELPAGFKIHKTAHYVICYNTSRAYAQWSGALYERLYRGFVNYWSQRGIEIHDPAQPMVAVVFDNQASFAKYSERELGAATSSVIGYYSMQTNRVAMYDLTGTSAQSGVRRSTVSQINQVLSRPEAEWTVATIVHEATHQLAFNCGMQQRYADIPLWISEGLAIYFETPDLGSSKGWRSIGKVNRTRLARAKQVLSRSNQAVLPGLLSSDDSFRKAASALDSYALAWSLNYYLLKRYPREYANYLKQLSEREALKDPPKGERIVEFNHYFGEDLNQFERNFRKYLASLR